MKLTAQVKQVVVRCIAKVAAAYKLDKRTQRVFRPTGAIAYDDRILRWRVAKGRVSLWTMQGRLTLPFVLATDSEGRQYSGKAIRSLRRRMRRLRAGLQSCGSKSAKRHLQRLRHRQSRFTKWVNHTISRRLVEAAFSSRKALVLEDLQGIRKRGNGFGREMRFELGQWAFNQLRQFVAYKARQAGLPVVFIDPRNTSRTCSACGYCDKANRTTQDRFSCLECGFTVNADRNAAVNIANIAKHGALVTRPKDGSQPRHGEAMLALAA